jgi:polyhydroxybutyrate depolymerase
MSLSYPGKLISTVMLLVFMWGIGLAEDVTESVTTSDARDRTYFLHTPPGYDGETPLPLLISLHYGGFEQGEEMATLTRMSEKADQEGFIVAYPDALAPGWSNYDALFLDELVDTLKARYAVDSQRVFMTGYSAGALMTHWMACKLSNQVAAFAPVAGTILTYDWSDCHPSRPPSIISFNARNDPLVPYEGDGATYTPVEEAMSNWAERLECDIGPDSFYNETGALRQTWSRTDGACEVVLWTTEDGGHGWPTELSPHKIPANDLMWEFFCAHPMPVEEPGIKESISPPSYELDPVTPGIFTQSAVVRFSLDREQHVTLKLFDILGREIATLLDKVVDTGEHSVLLDVTDLQDGIYFYRFSTPLSSKTGRLTVIK